MKTKLEKEKIEKETTNQFFLNDAEGWPVLSAKLETFYPTERLVNKFIRDKNATVISATGKPDKKSNTKQPRDCCTDKMAKLTEGVK